jgi:SRSO17 transposase
MRLPHHSSGVQYALAQNSFLKKGTHAVGVGSPYRGVTGKVENCPVGVFLAYVRPRGQTLYARARYLPREWTEDPQRRAAAAVPPAVRFATKPRLATTRLLRALESGLPGAWVTGDEV